MGAAATWLVAAASQAQTFIETFNNAPDYTNNWHISANYGATQIKYTAGNMQLYAGSSYPYPPGSNVRLSTNQIFSGDIDVTFEYNHQGYGRTNVGLISANDATALALAALDTDDTNYLNFIVPPNSTEYEHSGSPYMNRWTTIRIKVEGTEIKFYASVDGNPPELLNTLSFSSAPSSFRLFFDAGSVPWKSGPNITSFSSVIAYGTLAPTISGVSPNPVPAFNGQQAFTITGNNFDADCSVTLRQVSTGEVFLNRPKFSQTANQIVLKPNFTTTVSQWTVEVINPDGSSSGQFPFNVSNATISLLSISGPPSVASGTFATYTVSANYSDGTSGDVTTSCRLQFSGVTPSYAGIGGTTLFVNSNAPATTLNLIAVYSDVTRQVLSPAYAVSIAPTFSASMTASAQYTSGTNYTITLNGTVSGGSPLYTFRWDTNNDGTYGDLTGSTASYSISSQGGTYKIGLEVTDSNGAKAYASYKLSVTKPRVTGEPTTTLLPTDTAGDRFLGIDLQDVQFDNEWQTRRSNGLIVITHGIDSSASAAWLSTLASTIQSKLGPDAPNVVLFDWSKDADILITDTERESIRDQIAESGLFLPGYARLLVGTILNFDLNLEMFPDVILDGIVSRFGKGKANGQILADWVSRNSQPGSFNIDPSKPIQLIGHSGGGFVMGECARDLFLRARVDLVTMLDTPAPIAADIQDQEATAYIERYWSSVYGALEFPIPPPPIPDMDHYWREAHIKGLIDMWKTNEDGHGYSYVWYQSTVNTPSNTGFNRSPFVSSATRLNKIQLNGQGNVKQFSGVGLRASTPYSLPDEGLSGFSSFGDVSSTPNGFIVTESADAGITQTLTIPVGAVSLKFRYKFIGAGDSDFLSLNWNSLPAVYVGKDLDLSESDFVDAAIPLDFVATRTGTLTFTLVSRGSANAVLDIEDIRFGMSDDVDGDGLTNDQEAAIGTNARKADTDGDGLSDGDEVNIYHTNPLLVDTDGDGMSDGDEIAAGTDPNSNSSVFQITSVQPAAGGGLTITWIGNPSATYSVLRSSDLSFTNYDVIASGIPGNAATYTDTTIPAGATSVFYKVRIDVDPSNFTPITTAPVRFGLAQLGNISTRLSVGTGDNVLIGGFIINGTQPKKVIVRAIGPSLSQYGVPGVLADPTLELHDGSGALIATNDNWQTTQIGGIITSDQSTEIQNSGLAPSQAAESAIIATLQPGNYTAIVRGKNNTTGVALVEGYDLDRTVDSKLANISTRGFVQTGDNVMIGGLIIQGIDPARVIIRAIGPTLSQYSVPNVLADPTLELHDGNGALMSFNDNWKDTQQAEIQATGLPPPNDAESAILATLSPGNYTAIVRGKNNTTGNALVEAYQLGN